MSSTVQAIFEQFNQLSDEHQLDFIVRLTNTQQEKSWYQLLDSLTTADISLDDIAREVESVRTQRYHQSASH